MTRTPNHDFPRRRNQQAGRKRPRRGATLVLVGIVMTILMMFGGFALDFSRMYTFVAQLKVLTDAAALAAAIELRNAGTEADAKARALALRPGNTVEGGQLAMMADSNITPGTWNFSTRTFTPGTWAGATAVRARARHTADWTLARIFGVTNRVLMQETVAAVGSQVASNCLKPFAIPYGALLPLVGQPSTNLSHTLTSDDLTRLATPTQVTWAMQTDLVSASSPPGSFSMVGFDPTYSNMTNNSYLDLIIPPGCNSDPVSVGTQIPAITGVAQGLSLPGLRLLCPGAQSQGDQDWSCAPAPTFQVPIYDQVTGTGSNATYRVKYIGAFRMTAIDFQGNNNNITGYLTIAPAQGGGGFSSAPGPVAAAAIVQ